jgi:hypothetical protein
MREGFNAPVPGPITTDLPPRSPTRPGRSRGGRARPPIRRTTPSGSRPARRADRALPLGAPASFDYTGFNGRALAGDVMDVMLSLRANSAPGDGVAPDPALIRADFPYLRIPAGYNQIVVSGTSGLTADGSLAGDMTARPPGRGKDPAGYVDPARHSPIPGLRQVPHAHRDDHAGDRQVDHEDQPPGHSLHQPSAEKLPDRGGHTGQA